MAVCSRAGRCRLLLAKVRGRRCRCRGHSTGTACLRFTTPFGPIFDFWMSVTLWCTVSKRVCAHSWVALANRMREQRTRTSVEEWRIATDLVSMPEPCRSLLLAADQSNPLPAASTKTLPHIEIAFSAAGFLRSLECCTGRCAHTVRERLVIPKCTVL